MRVLLVKKYKDSAFECVGFSQQGQDIIEQANELRASNYLVQIHLLQPHTKRFFNESKALKPVAPKKSKKVTDTE